MVGYKEFVCWSRVDLVNNDVVSFDCVRGGRKVLHCLVKEVLGWGKRMWDVDGGAGVTKNV